MTNQDCNTEMVRRMITAIMAQIESVENASDHNHRWILEKFSKEQLILVRNWVISFDY